MPTPPVPARASHKFPDPTRAPAEALIAPPAPAVIVQLFTCSPIPELEKLGRQINPSLRRLFYFFIAKDINFYLFAYTVYFLSEEGVVGKSNFIFKTIFPARLVMAHSFSIPFSRVNIFHYIRRIAACFLFFKIFKREPVKKQENFVLQA